MDVVAAFVADAQPAAAMQRTRFEAAARDARADAALAGRTPAARVVAALAGSVQ